MAGGKLLPNAVGLLCAGVRPGVRWEQEVYAAEETGPARTHLALGRAPKLGCRKMRLPRAKDESTKVHEVMEYWEGRRRVRE